VSREARARNVVTSAKYTPPRPADEVRHRMKPAPARMAA
jgi:hypothetical protein